jgi:hypothetical protein
MDGLKTFLCVLVVGISSNANADWFEELAKVAIANEIVEQIDNGKITDLNLPQSLVANEIKRIDRDLKLRAEYDIAIKKSQLRQKIRNCVNYQMRECDL